MLGLIFGLFSFIGSIAANFLWWWQQQNPQFIFISGGISLILFFVAVMFLFYMGKNLIEKK